MEQILSATVYTAHRGYAWSTVPPGTDEDELAALVNLATDGEEPQPDGTVRRGVVANGRHAAAFALRTLPDWDSEGRAAIFAAFVLFPCILADRIDAAELLADPFFDTVTRTPPNTVRYTAGGSAAPATDAAGRLLSRNRIDGGFDPHAVGALLQRYARESPSWLFRLEKDGSMSVKTAPWSALGRLTGHTA